MAHAAAALTSAPTSPPDRVGATRRARLAAPTVLELAALLAVVVLLWPLFDQVAAFGEGRDARFGAGAATTSAVAAAKDAATAMLFRDAGVRWAGALALAYGLLVASRDRRIAPFAGAALALAAWSAAAWLADVPSPFAARTVFEPARGALPALPALPALSAAGGPTTGAFPWPATFVLVTVALAVIAAAVALLPRLGAPSAARDAAVRGRQTMSTRLGVAGLALWTGLGALLLLDLSAHAHVANRYLALYHQSHLWLGFTLFSTLAFLRAPLAHGLARMLALVGEALAAARRRLGAPLLGAIAVAAAALAVAVFAAALANLRQLTSELGRVWIVVGAAWFFYLRAGPLADRLARAGSAFGSLVRYTLPLAVMVGVLLAAMVATRDLGPLLIAGYGAGAFVAATLATWAHRRGLAAWWASGFGVAIFAVWIGAVTAALFAFGGVDPTTAARLESLASPFSAANDQQALVAWFREATPAGGFGIGHVPWCGWSAGPRCGGVPAQIHSDYTFTALVGVFGRTAAWAVALGAALWLHRLVRHHARVTTGEPRLALRASDRGAGAGRYALDGQALASWLALAWVVLALCQLAVTVAGNLGVLPLTGVTFPFVSFGLTSNAVNLAFLAMAIQVTVSDTEGGRG